MMKSMFLLSVPAAALSLMTLPAAAHHSQAIYDTDQIVTIEGIVTDYRWTNPHTYLYVETQSDSGETVVRAIEGQVTAIMRRLGWDSDTFAPGDHVIVRAHPSRDPKRTMALIYSAEKNGVTWSGDVEPLRSLGKAAGRADSLSGIWEVPFTPLIRLFSEPSSWAVTAKGAEGVASYDDRSMNPQLQCIPRAAPWLMIFTGVHKIELGDSVVWIRTEYNTVDREVHMNASHDGAAFTRQGHSIGRWDGDVLVVDTTHFADNRSGHARGIRSGARKHLVERFSLDPGGESLTYRFELEDPEYLAAPVTGELQAAYRPDLDFRPVPCDLDTAGRFTSDAE
jgi:hypothetical protein